MMWLCDGLVAYRGRVYSVDDARFSPAVIRLEKAGIVRRMRLSRALSIIVANGEIPWPKEATSMIFDAFAHNRPTKIAWHFGRNNRIASCTGPGNWHPQGPYNYCAITISSGYVDYNYGGFISAEGEWDADKNLTGAQKYDLAALPAVTAMIIDQNRNN